MAEPLEDRSLLAALSISLQDSHHDEGGQYYAAVFHVTLTGAVTGGFRVSFHTVEGTAIDQNTSTPNYDFWGQSGTLTFAGNNNEVQDVSVNIHTDSRVELDETFSLSLDEIVAPEGSTDPAPTLMRT